MVKEEESIEMIEVELNPPFPNVTNFEMVNEDLGQNYPFFKKEVEEKCELNNENELEDVLIDGYLTKKEKKDKAILQPLWRESIKYISSLDDEIYESK